MNLPLMLASVALASILVAQPGPPPGRGGDRHGPLPTVEAPSGPGIAWFGTWAEARDEARRTGRPILFMSAAPQCHLVPGTW